MFPYVRLQFESSVGRVAFSYLYGNLSFLHIESLAPRASMVMAESKQAASQLRLFGVAIRSHPPHLASEYGVQGR